MKRLLVLLLAAIQIRCPDCQYLKYNEDLRKVFVLHPIDTIIIQILFPIALLSCIGIIIVYAKFEGVREPPGDVFLALTLSSIFIFVSYFATAMYNQHYPTNGDIPSSFHTFCTTTGYFYVLSFCSTIVYNIVFCIYFIVQLKNTLKEYGKKWLVHVICLTVVGLAGLIFYLTDGVGISLLGICAMKISSVSIFTQSGLVFIYLLVLITSAVYFKKYIPRQAIEQPELKRFIRYYYRYLVAISISNILCFICYLGAGLACLFDLKNLDFFITIANTMSLATPIIIFIVMLWHPEVVKSIRMALIKAFGENRRNFEMDETRDVEIEMTQSKDLFQRLMAQKKQSLIYTLLSSIYIENQHVNPYNSLKSVSDWNMNDVAEIEFNDSSLVDYEDIRVPGMKAMDVKIRSYCPRIFKTLMKMEGLVDFKKHIQPNLNEQNIRRQVQSDGGKSGQFFFFSHDNRVILKTLQNKELVVVMEVLKNYVQHFIDNPNSLITKICGIYTLIDQETQQEYTVYAMRNLAGCDRKFISRVYDLKGSKFDRQVLKDYTNVQVGHLSKTMKDQDFEKIEKRLKIPAQEAKELRGILIEDCKFFKQQQLIDYSLIVLKIQVDELMKSRHQTKEEFLQTIANPYSVLFSEEKGMAYVIGIIDYLETWNVNKKSERFFKSVFFKTKTEEISAQEPTFYSDRFINELVMKIL